MELGTIGITAKKAKQFERKKIYSVEDLLTYFPKKYNNYISPKTLMPLRVLSFTEKPNGNTPYLRANCISEDNTRVVVIWYRQEYKWKEIQRAEGTVIRVPVEEVYYDDKFFHCLACSSPSIYFEEWETPGLIPVYPKISGMSYDYLCSKIDEAIRSRIPDPLPVECLKDYNLFYTAMKGIHHPKSVDDYLEGKRRAVYNELVYFALRQGLSNVELPKNTDIVAKDDKALIEFIDKLPFGLTEDQKSAIENIKEHAMSGKRINMLLQGDVGCGKTICAFSAMVLLAANGYQCALMAPTQVLATQHYNDAVKLFGEDNVVFLHSGMKVSEKKKALKKIREGTVSYIVGTHSLIGKDVVYKNLGLVVTDEEHKFGVLQRKTLIEKTSSGVHNITMSATPIPRSLASVVYGDHVELQTIKTMPNGRKPVRTGIARDREKIYDFLEKEVRKGHQGYVVCPAIDSDNIEGNVEQAEETYGKELRRRGIVTGILTGKTKKEETAKILSEFKDGKIDILISTTVVEVGVNVPNATAMVISGAEHFGLSQIHQLRGRVGRGNDQSYCALELFSYTDKAVERMNILCENNDGFAIAEADLKIRGTGDLLGTKQSGENKYVLLMLSDPEIYTDAKETAKDILENQKECVLLKKAIKDYEDTTENIGTESKQ